MVARAILIVLVLGLAACFSLAITNGSIACSDDPTRPCPSGYACVNDRCWLRTTSFDGGSAGGGD